MINIALVSFAKVKREERAFIATTILWDGQHRTHAQNHTTRQSPAVIRQPWMAQSVSTLLLAFYASSEAWSVFYRNKRRRKWLPYWCRGSSRRCCRLFWRHLHSTKKLENIVSKRDKVYALAAGKFDNCKREGTKEQPNFIVSNKAEKMTQATTAEGSIGQIKSSLPISCI